MIRKVFGIFILFCFLSTSKAQVSFTLNNVYCSGGSLNLTSATTLTSVSYTWSALPSSVSITSPNAASTGMVFNSPGNYTVWLNYSSGTLSGVYQNTTTVVNASSLFIQISQTSNTTCITNNSPKLSKPVILSTIGAAAYVWFPYNPATMTYSLGQAITVRPHTSTCYTVIGTNAAACTGSAVTCVTVIPQFSVNVVPYSPTICVGDSIQLAVVNIGTGAVGSTGSAFTFSWSAPNGLQLGASLGQTVLAFPQITTTFTTEAADSINCISLPRTTTVHVGNCVVGLSENELLRSNFKLYPNPASHELFVETVRTQYNQVKLFDARGQELFAPMIKVDGKIRIDLNTLKDGLYTIRLTSNNKLVYSYKFIKTNN